LATKRTLHSSIKIPADGGRLRTDEWTVSPFERVGVSPNMASLAWALLFLAVWLVVLWRLSRRGLVVRV
jgi:hypothetical protein